MAEQELTVRNLFVARGGRPVLRDVSISIPPGEITALLGANGAGKSTLVLTIAGILPALSGDISCGGVALLGQSPDAVRRQGVALVLEGHPVLIGLSVRDNLAAAALMHTRRDADREIEAALEIFPELRSPALDTRAASIRRSETDGGDRPGDDLAAALPADRRIVIRVSTVNRQPARRDHTEQSPSAASAFC